MHTLAVKEIVKVCQQREREGDCPTVPAPSVETLEDAVVTLARMLETARIGARLPSNEALRRRIASDPDVETEAGPRLE